MKAEYVLFGGLFVAVGVYFAAFPSKQRAVASPEAWEREPEAAKETQRWGAYWRGLFFCLAGSALILVGLF